MLPDPGQSEKRVSDPRTNRLYYRARIHRWLGNSERAGRLCRSALAFGDHEQARKLLAGLELPGEDYFRVLERMHRYLKPATYVEIGIWKGKSLRLARPPTLAIGIDPEPQLKVPPAANVRVFSEPSDAFFARHDLVAEFGGQRVDLALIDGMHHFEFALRDFVNLERAATPRSVILIHDCRPLDAESAARDRSTVFWSGDVWRLIVLLRKHRPDLVVHTIATPPTGLGMILNLDPASTALGRDLDAIIGEGLALPYAELERRKAEMLNLYPNDWTRIRALLDARPQAR
jgi:hypothetical protein